jgi:hypothetical protein
MASEIKPDGSIEWFNGEHHHRPEDNWITEPSKTKDYITMTKFCIDFENNGERWFAHADNEMDPVELQEFIDNKDRMELGIEVYVTDERGQEILQWCEQAPGWRDGPEHARTALHYETGIALENVLANGDPCDRVWINGNCWQITESG